MRYRILLALLAASALAGCGVRGATTTGERIRSKPLSASHRGCPSQDRRKPVNTALAANTSLVPGHPNAVLLCRYSGLNDPRRFTLVSHRLISSPTTVDRLAHALDSLPKIRPGTTLNCPADFADTMIAFFRYPNGPDDPVTMGLSGCGATTNGQLTRLALGQSPPAAELEKLAPR